MVTDRLVACLRRQGATYPDVAPFDPALAYPEYPFERMQLSAANDAYDAVRDVLRLAGLDAGRFGAAEWNPFGDLVARGATVLIKPNWVRHYHVTGEDLFSVITHPSVVRALVDYAFKAVGPEGKIWVMDAPQFDADFEVLKERCSLDLLESELRRRGVPIRIADMRSLVVEMDSGVVVRRVRRQFWETEGVVFDLGLDSELAELGASMRNVFGSDYDRRVTARHHTAERHEYKIAKRVLEADLVISAPKLKTHKKTGVTLNVKNMIGINVDKNFIPHYRVGAPADGGDEFPDTDDRMKRARRRVIRHTVDQVLGRMGERGERATHTFMRGYLRLAAGRAMKSAGRRLEPVDVFYRGLQGDTFRTGNWWGNDTCWRCALDMNKLLLHGRADGTLSEAPARRYFSVIDGIVGGDQDGPMSPRPRPEGVLVAGFDPISVDQIATRIMGLPSERIRDQARGEALTRYTLTRPDAPIRTRSNWGPWDGTIAPSATLGFEPHFAWVPYLLPARVS